MGKLIENRPIQCIYHGCGYGPIFGKESEQKDHQGNIILECKWVCPKCFRTIRSDEKIIPKDEQ